MNHDFCFNQLGNKLSVAAEQIRKVALFNLFHFVFSEELNIEHMKVQNVLQTWILISSKNRVGNFHIAVAEDVSFVKDKPKLGII